MKRKTKRETAIGCTILLILAVMSTRGEITTNYWKIVNTVSAAMKNIFSNKSSFLVVAGILVLAVAWLVFPKLWSRISWSRQKKRYLLSDINKVDSMSGEEFELFLKAHLEKQGYRADTTKRSHDYGCDLILQKKGTWLVLQAKRSQSDIGIKAVQEILGAKNYYRADKAIVATNRLFSKPARDLAQSSSIILWDRKEIEHIMKNNPATIPDEEEKSEPYIDREKACPLCGSPMILRKGKFGSFSGCTNYPLCKGTRK